MNATELIKQRTDACLALASPALSSLGAMAKRYGLLDDSMRFDTIKRELGTDIFRLLTAGRFKNGKSTLTNALLGRCTTPIPDLPRGGAPLPSHELPCTAVLTTVKYAENPYVKVVYKEEKCGRNDPWTFQRFLEESKVKRTTAENDAFFGEIAEFELGLPVELCSAGITLVDSPGLDDDLARDEITRDAMEKASASITMLRSDSLGGIAELKYVRDMIQNGVSVVFVVVNLWDGRPVDEELKARVWDKLVTGMLEGERYCGQNLTEQRIYFVDARRALEAKLTGNQAALEVSGMAHFEEHLRRFLEHDKRAIQIERFLNGANAGINSLKKEIQKRLVTICEDKERFEAKYLQIQPMLEDLRRKRSSIPEIFQRHRQACILRIQDSFSRLDEDMHSRIETDTESIQIPSLHGSGLAGFWDKFSAAWKQKKLADEIGAIMAEKLQGHLTRWQREPVPDGAQKIIGTAMDELFMEVRQKVAEIESAYDAAQLELSGGSLGAQKGVRHGPGLPERVIAGGLGVMTGNPDYMFTGGTMGFGGMGRDLLGRLAVGGVMLLLHAPLVAFPPALIAAGVLTNVIWGASSTEKKLRKVLAENLRYGNKKESGEGSLSQQLKPMKADLPNAVNRYFDKVQAAIMEKTDVVMEEQERSFQEQARINRLSAAEKDREVAGMEKDVEDLKSYRNALHEAKAQAVQLEIPVTA